MSLIKEIVSTTLRNRDSKRGDLVANNNALLYALKKKGKIQKVLGGEKLYQPLTFQSNGNEQWYSGMEELSVSQRQTITMAEYEWKQASVAVVFSGLETDVQNVGKHQAIDLAEFRIENAESSLGNLIEAGIFSDGTGAGGKQITGLQAQIATVPTSGTVGGIDRVNYTWWRNGTTVSGTAATKANIQERMNLAFMSRVRGTDRPDLLVGDDAYWAFYHDSLTEIQRITNVGNQFGEAGFMTLDYKGVPFVHAGGKGGSCRTNTIYFLNTKHFFFKVAQGRFMETAKAGKRYPINQDGHVELLLFAGNLTSSDLSLQHVLTQS
jgi:hypothetical protein